MVIYKHPGTHLTSFKSCLKSQQKSYRKKSLNGPSQLIYRSKVRSFYWQTKETVNIEIFLEWKDSGKFSST